MASLKTIEIVKSTAPVLQVHGESITTEFYKLLFENHPELKDVFNMTHQKKGSQPKALANAVFQYAVHIEKLEMLGTMVEGIAQKHSSLSVTAEMYPIVGKYLLIAIKNVLKEAATDEIINAWAEAYGDLAVIFITREEEIYSEAEEQGGFRGKEEFVVVKKVEESEVITSFYLKGVTLDKYPNYKPGQYIAVSTNIPGESHKHARNYSLSDSSDKDYLRISVKKETGMPNGIVSNYLHEDVSVGDVLKIGIPAGDFYLKETENPILLIGAGVGVTPLLSMYKSALKNKKVNFIQCAINGKTHAFKEEILADLTSNVNYINIYSDPLPEDKLGIDYDYKGFVNKEIIKKYITENTEIYFCGPVPFMSNVLRILKDLKISEDKINFEFFGTKEELAIV